MSHAPDARPTFTYRFRISLAMLSYRHGFHAGNHADVLKHTVVVQLLRYLNKKDKSYWYIDTHAGAGVYSLFDGYAAKTGEFGTGIEKIWDATDLPEALSDYVDEVRALNRDGELRYYPGSPYLAWRLMREQDRMRLFELHSTEIDVLRHNFRDAGRRAMIYAGDGFEGIKALLPPPPRRARVGGSVIRGQARLRENDRLRRRKPEAIRDGVLCNLVSAGEPARIAEIPRPSEAVAAEQLAASELDREPAAIGRLWSFRQRDVHSQPAVSLVDTMKEALPISSKRLARTAARNSRSSTAPTDRGAAY